MSSESSRLEIILINFQTWNYIHITYCVKMWAIIQRKIPLDQRLSGERIVVVIWHYFWILLYYFQLSQWPLLSAENFPNLVSEVGWLIAELHTQQWVDCHPGHQYRDTSVCHTTLFSNILPRHCICTVPLPLTLREDTKNRRIIKLELSKIKLTEIVL